MLNIGVISLIPEIFDSLKYGITGRAIEQGLVNIDYWNPRTWATGHYRHVDDKPYGGGPGMVMLYEPLHAAIVHAAAKMPKNLKVIYLSPQGKTIKQERLNQIAKNCEPLLFLAGRYEGIDERVIAEHVDEEWSLGDFILSGGELAAMVYIDALIRLLPGSLNHVNSAADDSFMNGLLEYPQYTRPAEINGASVPKVLLSGNHRDITRWRRKQALGITKVKRPDLLEQLTLNEEDMQLLVEYISEQGS